MQSKRDCLLVVRRVVRQHEIVLDEIQYTTAAQTKMRKNYRFVLLG